MAADNQLIIKKLQGMDTFYAAFSDATRLPYVACDQETFDDQVYIFAEEKDADEWAKAQAEEKIAINTAKVEKGQMLMFYTSLYLIGANRLVFHNGAGSSYLPLDQVVTINEKEDEKNGLPQRNTTLQLTMIYFLQELRRYGELPQDEERKRHIHDLEQEMVANLMRSKYIMAIDISKVEGEFVPGKPGQNIQIPYLKNPAGEILQPIFSDLWEFQKFSKNYGPKMQLGVTPFKGLLPSLIKDAKGYILNPAGVNLILLREKLEVLSRQTDDGAQQ